MFLMRSLYPVLCLSIAGFLTGCARYDFSIDKPTNLSARIGEVATRVETANMVYNMQAKENRLVLLIYNNRPDPVQILGDRSFVVDPHGVSHPLRSQAIGPNAYAKVILPPLKPKFENSPGWHFGVGVGTPISDNSPKAVPVRPLFLDYFSDRDAFYWDWDGPTMIRLSITYRFGDNSERTDEFSFRKVPAEQD